jgi:hypothetical protein
MKKESFGIDKLYQSWPDVPQSIILKVELLRVGLRIEDSAIEAFRGMNVVEKGYHLFSYDRTQPVVVKEGIPTDFFLRRDDTFIQLRRAESSPYSILISGGKTTVANLFYNMSTRQIGLVGMWDVVAFDEVAGIQFSDKTAIQILKDYMESGSFSRGREELVAEASMVSRGISTSRWSSKTWDCKAYYWHYQILDQCLYKCA